MSGICDERTKKRMQMWKRATVALVCWRAGSHVRDTLCHDCPDMSSRATRRNAHLNWPSWPRLSHVVQHVQEAHRRPNNNVQRAVAVQVHERGCRIRVRLHSCGKDARGGWKNEHVLVHATFCQGSLEGMCKRGRTARAI
eukprot:354416-Chlamydomonas_euryale.AAC.5